MSGADRVRILARILPMKFLYIASRLLQLLSIPGVAGHEAPVREAIELALPLNARVRADSMGNIILRSGSGAPHTVVVAPLDEGGLVVSAITPDGYVRAHRHTAAPGPRLSTQYLVGQPIEIRSASGHVVPGVSATPSTHLRAFRDPQEDARIKGLDDIWIDVGADSAASVERLGIRMLDPITLRDRATLLANGRVSGVSAGGRAAALALVEAASRRQPGPRPEGTVTIAWVTQSEYGQRGLLRVIESLKPDRLILLRGSMAPGDDPSGAIGQLGGGPVLVGDPAALGEVASREGIATQRAPAPRGGAALPPGLPVHVAMVPVSFAQTPVETVDARDIDALAQLVASAVGFGKLAESTDQPEPVQTASPALTDDPDPAHRTLGALIESYGVSGHEAPVREQILKRMPAWARPQVDTKGNVRVVIGPESGKSLVFVAHMDEVGFEIVTIEGDGRATVRTRGGMYLSLYEAHPMVVVTPEGMVPAVLTPRRGYTTATEAQPDIKELRLHFGTDSADATKALGVAEGQSATVRKRFVPLADGRSTGRAMDDRNGSTALLLALAAIDPAKLTNRVTFAWAVEEETGLSGAAFMATEIFPHTAFAVDTFVSTDTPVDVQRLAGAKLGEGAVLRGLDSRSLVPSGIIDRIVAIARARKIPLQIGVTSGGTDASAFSARGAIDAGLSWPGRYSHSPVEVMDRKDLEALVDLIAALAMEY
jgi:putative aminopeptidase FrvX